MGCLLASPRCTHVSEVRLLDTSLDDSSSSFVGTVDEFSGDDGGRDGLGGVDNLLDTRDSEGNVHGSDSGEMESLERHLRTRFSDRLSTNRSDRSSYNHRASVRGWRVDEEGHTRLDLGSDVLRPAELEESANLRLGDLGLVVDDGDLSSYTSHQQAAQNTEK